MKPPAVRNPVVGKLNALAVFGAWFCLVLFFVSLVYLKVFADSDGSAMPLVILFGTFFGLAVVHVALSFLVRCPCCSKPMTIQGIAKPKGGDWSGVVLKWFTGSVVCIHCGNRVLTSGRSHDL
jgi:hypothetical protein